MTRPRRPRKLRSRRARDIETRPADRPPNWRPSWVEGGLFQPEHVPERHAAVAARLTRAFDVIRIGLTFVNLGGWHAIHTVPSISLFEHEHGLEHLRFAYNKHGLDEATRTRKLVVTEHAGFSDLFVPVVRNGQVHEVLIAGAFRLNPVSSAEIQERWRELTGHHGHLGDPEFAHYVTTFVETPLLEPRTFEAFKHVVSVLAQLIEGEKDADALSKAVAPSEAALVEATLDERIWASARQMLDAPTARAWASDHMALQRRELGLRQLPTQVLVGFFSTRVDETDPVDDVIRRHRFQLACTRFARERGNMLAAPVGSHGVVLVKGPEASDTRSRSRLVALAESVAQLAKREFRFKLHVGIGPTSGETSLPARYALALSAAEEALSRGARSVHAQANAKGPTNLGNVRTRLSRLADPMGKNLRGRFDGFLEAVANHTGHRLERALGYLEAGLDRLAEPLLESGALDARSYDDLSRTLAKTAEGANTLSELFAAYRAAVDDMQRVLENPAAGHQDRSLRRAVAFIREHATEDLTRERVARVAGFAPSYFSRLFHKHERITFEEYLTTLRIERAKQLLQRTGLSAGRIAQLSGFASAGYFCRVFRRMVGESPLEFRRRPA